MKRKKNNKPVIHSSAKIDLQPCDWVSPTEAIRCERNTMPVGMKRSPELVCIAKRKYHGKTPAQTLPNNNLLTLGLIHLN